MMISSGSEVETLVTFGRWVVIEKNVKGDLWYPLHVLFLVGGDVFILQ